MWTPAARAQLARDRIPGGFKWLSQHSGGWCDGRSATFGTGATR